MQTPILPDKICSRCKTRAPFDAFLCEQCGMIYPTQSGMAPAIPIEVTSASRSGQKNGVFVGIFLTVLVVASVLAVQAWHGSEHSPPPLPVSAATQPVNAAARNVYGAGRSGASMAPNPQFYHKDKGASHDE